MNKKDRIGADKIGEFLKEDIGHGDITSSALINPNQMAKARLFYREAGVAAGLEEACMVFEKGAPLLQGGWRGRWAGGGLHGLRDPRL
jgi:nicotinate-nucleotide pyrophosphorylase